MKNLRPSTSSILISKADWEPFQHHLQMKTQYNLIRPPKQSLKSKFLVPVSNQACFQVKCMVQQFQQSNQPDFVLHPTCGIFNTYHHDQKNIQPYKIQRLENQAFNSHSQKQLDNYELKEQLIIQTKLIDLCVNKARRWRKTSSGEILFK
ncbi:hypothetical protein SS50377_21966 [Spironucleus salmonicida]|uniref:Uncharacterized protein n=1 Tax=Spironucleus salmonicida TaxID=348837 RepID=V6LQY4_9EUKA|nr:hypothetical protein SS50377_21966 [Spironucleus salmonicida]|eukprot:EST47005.1 Hypothetical protein SS50377_jh053 [Spironucleus salmonicida]